MQVSFRMSEENTAGCQVRVSHRFFLFNENKKIKENKKINENQRNPVLPGQEQEAVEGGGGRPAGCSQVGSTYLRYLTWESTWYQIPSTW